MSFRWLWPYVRRQWGAIVAVMTLAALTSALAAAQPYLSKLIIDGGLIGRHFHLLVVLCGAVVALAACGFALGALNRLLYVRLSSKVLFAIREDVYSHILTLPPRFFRVRPVGDLVARLDGDVAEIQRFSTDSMLALVNGVLLLLFSAAIMVAMSPALTLIAAGTLPFHLLVRHRARRQVADSTREVRESRGAITDFLVETLGAAKAVQSSGAEHFERERLEKLNQGLLRRVIRQQLVGYAVGAFTSLLSHMTTAIVFIAGGWEVIHGSLTVGTLVAFTAYLTRGTGSAASLMGLYTAYQRAGVSLKRVQELRDVEPMRTPGHGARTLPASAGAIRLQHLSFRYAEGARAVLENLDLEIEAGSKVVLFGDSGAGKSTLVDLLRGFAEPVAGRIMLDGLDLREYDIRSVRRRIPVLETDPVLFRGTIIGNLRYGNFDVPTEQVLEAARHTDVERFVLALPQEYATELGARGAGLSTGQRQRIAVARALLGAPFALVLDEATSNLDAAAVRSMHELIDRTFGRCTRIVITHAPQAVPRADRVLELCDGRIIERPRASAHAHA
ncbi:MAG: ABC transporter ATP-binding protein [Steroidobacteraceae bacterium]